MRGASNFLIGVSGTVGEDDSGTLLVRRALARVITTVLEIGVTKLKS